MRLSKTTDGPISPPGQGGKVKVVKADLIRWWNSLQERHDESMAEATQAALDQKVTVESKHNFGRAGTVVPAINGAVKKGRNKS